MNNLNQDPRDNHPQDQEAQKAQQFGTPFRFRDAMKHEAFRHVPLSHLDHDAKPQSNMNTAGLRAKSLAELDEEATNSAAREKQQYESRLRHEKGGVRAGTYRIFASGKTHKSWMDNLKKEEMNLSGYDDLPQPNTSVDGASSSNASSKGLLSRISEKMFGSSDEDAQNSRQ